MLKLSGRENRPPVFFFQSAPFLGLKNSVFWSILLFPQFLAVCRNQLKKHVAWGTQRPMWCDVCPSRQAICSWSLEEVAKAHLLDYEWKPHWVGEAESPTEKRIEEAELQENNLLQGENSLLELSMIHILVFLCSFFPLVHYLNLSRLLQHVCKNWGSTGSMWWVPFQLSGQREQEFRWLGWNFLMAAAEARQVTRPFQHHRRGSQQCCCMVSPAELQTYMPAYLGDVLVPICGA